MLVVAAALIHPSAARAVTVQGVVHNVPYVIGFRPLNSHQQPYLGQMHLNFNHGIISGTYTDISTRPGGPLANARNVAVQGGITRDHLTLLIRHVTFRGSMNGDRMSGSGSVGGRIYQFEARPGSPGSGKRSPSARRVYP
jgi:hypothetical protein